MSYIAKIRATQALTKLLGKLGVPSCIQHRVTFDGWSGPGGKPYIKHGMVNSKIHEFMERRKTKDRKLHQRTRVPAPRK